MNEPIQYVNIVYFDVDANRLETQMENFEKSRTRYVQTWGHLLNEHGLYWGREVAAGKRERLWTVTFLKDEHSQEKSQNSSEYGSWKADTNQVLPFKLLNRPVQASMPLHELLQAGVVVVAYHKLSKDQSNARFEELGMRFLNEVPVDCPGFRGAAYALPANEGERDYVSFGAWDSLKACGQLDERHAELVAEMNEAFDTTESTLLTFVKFQKHIIS